MQKVAINSEGNQYSKVFRVAVCESHLEIQKYKIVIPYGSLKLKSRLL